MNAAPPPYASALVGVLAKNASLEVGATAPFRNLSVKAGEKPVSFSASAISADAAEACIGGSDSSAATVCGATHGNDFVASFAQCYNRRLSSLRQHSLEFIESIYCLNDYVGKNDSTKAALRHGTEEIIVEHTSRALCQSFPLIQFELEALASMVTTQVTNFTKVVATHVYPGDLGQYRNVDVESLTPATPMSYLDLVTPRRMFQDTLQVFMETEALLRSQSRAPVKGAPLHVSTTTGINGPFFALFGSISESVDTEINYAGTTIAMQTIALLTAAVKVVQKVSAKHVQLGNPCANLSSLEAALTAFTSQASPSPSNIHGALFAAPPLMTFDSTNILGSSSEAEKDVERFLTPAQQAASAAIAPILQLQLQHAQSLVGYTRTNLSKCTDKSEMGCAKYLNASLCHTSSLMQLADHSYRVGHYVDAAATIQRIHNEIENVVMPAIVTGSNVVGMLKAWASLLGAEETEAIACSAHIKELLPLKVKTTFAKFVTMHTLSAPVSHFSIDHVNNNIWFNLNFLVSKTKSVGGLKYRKGHQYPLFVVYAQRILQEVAEMQETLMSTAPFKSALLFARNSSQPFVMGLEFADGGDSGSDNEDRPVRRPSPHSTYFNLTSWNVKTPTSLEGSTPLFSPADFSMVSVIQLVTAAMCTRTFIASDPRALRGNGSCVRVTKCSASASVGDMYRVENRPVSASTNTLSLPLPSGSKADQSKILTTLLNTAASLRPFTLAPVDYSVVSSILLVGGGSREFLRYACLLALLATDAADLDKGFCNIPEIRTLLKREGALLLKDPSPSDMRPVSLDTITRDMVAGKFAAPLRNLSTDAFVRGPFANGTLLQSSTVLGLEWENNASVVGSYCLYSPLYWRAMPLLTTLLKEHAITRAIAPYAVLPLSKLAFAVGMCVADPAAPNPNSDVDEDASIVKAVATLEEQLKSLILARRIHSSVKIDRAAGCIVRAQHPFGGGSASSSSGAAAAATAGVALGMLQGQAKGLEEAVSTTLIQGYLEIGCIRGPHMVAGMKKSWERRSIAQAGDGDEGSRGFGGSRGLGGMFGLSGF